MSYFIPVFVWARQTPAVRVTPLVSLVWTNAKPLRGSNSRAASHTQPRGVRRPFGHLKLGQSDRSAVFILICCFYNVLNWGFKNILRFLGIKGQILYISSAFWVLIIYTCCSMAYCKGIIWFLKKYFKMDRIPFFTGKVIVYLASWKIVNQVKLLVITVTWSKEKSTFGF